MNRRVRRVLSWSAVFLLVGATVLMTPLSSASAAVMGVDVQSIDAGWNHSCAVRADHSAVCWGSDTYGQTDAPAGQFTSVAAGAYHSCGVRVDGTAVCWGKNDSSQASAPAGQFTRVDAGSSHSCGLHPDGTVACWGSDSFGVVSGIPADTKFTSISAGDDYNCGIRADSTIACWGWNLSGEADPPSGQFTMVSAGSHNTCALRLDGTVLCWGQNRAGENAAPDGQFSAVSAGYYDACGIRTDRTVACWGYNNSGETTAPQGEFRAVAAGEYHTCGIRIDGTATCWGQSFFGATGTAPAIPAPAPADATVGVAYSHTFTSARGTPAATFSVVSGALPNGLTLSSDGVISGTPTNGATSSFTVAAYDGVFTTATAQFTIAVTGGDTTPPATTIALSPSAPTGSNGWYTGPVTATVSATDSGSGVDQTRCALDPSAVPATFPDLPAGCDLTNPVTGQGQHTVYAASKDKTGNTEAVSVVSFKIDSVTPTLTPTLPDHVYLHQNGLTATPGASDATSGVASQSCGPVDTSSAGDHVLTCQATDTAGNQASVQVHYTVEYKILGLSLPLPGSTWRAGSTVPVTAALADASGTLIPTSEASALAKACRVTFSVTGAQTSPTQCLAYEPITHQFYAVWKTAKTPTGSTTTTVAITYPGTTTTTTKPTTFTLTR